MRGDPELERWLDGLGLLDVAQEELLAVAELIRWQGAQLRGLRARFLDVSALLLDGAAADAGPSSLGGVDTSSPERWSSLRSLEPEERVEEPAEEPAEKIARRLEDLVTSTARSVAAVRRASAHVRGASQELRRELTRRGASGDDELLWLQVGEGAYGLPTRFVGGLFQGGAPGAEGSSAVVPLGELLGLERERPAESQVALHVPGLEPITIAVERVGEVGQARVHPIPDLVRRSGPFAGAVRGPEDSLRLVLDARAVVLRAVYLRGADDIPSQPSDDEHR